MGDGAYGVHVVVDPDYGEHLRSLPADEPVWIVDSETNHPVVMALWQERHVPDHTAGVTSFKFDPSATPEDWFINTLWTIDLHHGQYSHDPPYSWVNVIGTPWSERVQEALDELGLFGHEETAEGFIARRNLDEWHPPSE